MHNRLLRPLLIIEFLIAMPAVFSLWSEVGGQYHLELMFWPWKLGLALAATSLIVATTANIIQNDGAITRRAILYCSLLIVTFAVAGTVTYYYHLNEPMDQEEDQEDDPPKISVLTPPDGLPGLAGLPSPDHR